MACAGDGTATGQRSANARASAERPRARMPRLLTAPRTGGNPARNLVCRPSERYEQGHMGRALVVLLCLSGATGLTYEVLWARDFALVYGSTALGTAVVLAAYFTGLAAGSALGGRHAARTDGLRLYAALEAGIAVSALAYVA